MEASMAQLFWYRFAHFFQLYEVLGEVPHLIYVIGEYHHCYIGSVGGQGGEGGLRVRYEPQYVNRAKAIFGQDFPIDQPAFAAITDETEIPTDQIVELERQVQQSFLEVVGEDGALFTGHREPPCITMEHEGDAPDFLRHD